MAVNDSRVLNAEREMAQRISALEERIRRLEAPELGRAGVVIEDTILAANAADITFSDIDQGFRHLRVIGALRSDRADTGDSLGVQLNGDASSGNYYSHRARHNQVDGWVSSEQIGTNFWSLTGVLGDNAIASAFAHVDIILPSYTRAIFQAATGFVAETSVESAGGPEIELAAGTWHDTSAITQVKFYPLIGSNWLAGSRLSLFGMG